MTWNEDERGCVSVQIEGVDFVKGGLCYEILLDRDAVTGFYTPFWPQNASYTIQADGTKKYNIAGAAITVQIIRILRRGNTMRFPSPC